MPRKIALLNHMGAGNLGDDATQSAVMQNIKRRWPDAEIAIFSMNPVDTHLRHGVISYPIRTETWIRREDQINSGAGLKSKLKNKLAKYRIVSQLLGAIHTIAVKAPQALFREIPFLVRSFRIIGSFDVLIISGGGQLLDSWGGPWKFPYTVFKWTLLAKFSRAKCYFLNVGAGPLSHPLGKWFVTRALRLADYVSFRDDESRDLVSQAGFAGKSQVSADCVYALETSASDSNTLEVHRHPVVGIAPMAYCDPRIYWQKDQLAYERFVENAVSFGEWLGRNQYDLSLFSTDICFDSRTAEEIKALIECRSVQSDSEIVTLQDIPGITELLSTMSSMDYIITCRFHGVVFAHLLQKPVIALSHHPKVSALMNDLGLGKYCIDINKCDLNILQEAFLSLVSNQDEIRDHMRAKAACYKRTLLTQFDQLFPQTATL